jgi:hypothetical protein
MNDYFCVLPFYGAEYNNNTTTPCCLLPYNTDIDSLRNEMLAGQRPSACAKCWKLEDQGKRSNRQILNQTFDVVTDRDIAYIEQDCHQSYSPQIIKLYTSNLCNSTCVTCNPTWSTAWGTLNKKPVYDIISSNLLDNIDYANIKMLSFVGGEPLIEAKNYAVLQKLLDYNNTNCRISVITNGSSKLSAERLELLKKFKHLDFCLSIDGVGPVFEYLRYPLKWTDLLDNIELYRQIGIHLSVSYTISNLNVLYHNETVKWFEEQDLEYNFNIVSDPAHFAPGVLPDSVKLQYPELQGFFNEYRPANLISLRYEIIRQDNLKKINIQDYLPEFYELVLR